jgi:hypothetical protein
VYFYLFSSAHPSPLVSNTKWITNMKKSKNLNITDLQQAALNADDPHAYLNGIYDYVKKQAIDSINWYLKRKGPVSFISKLLRFLAIIAATLGAVFPVLQGTDLITKVSWVPNNFSQYGYILLALAGGCVLLDKLFGFSSNWMRYMSTVMRLQTLLAQFEMDWAKLVFKSGSGSIDEEQQNKMIDCLSEFRLAVVKELQNETQKWIEEFRSNMAQLERYTDASKSPKRSGF